MAWPPLLASTRGKEATLPDLSIRNAGLGSLEYLRCYGGRGDHPPGSHVHVFFVAEKAGSLGFLAHGMVCGNDFAGSSRNNKEEFDLSPRSGHKGR